MRSEPCSFENRVTTCPFDKSLWKLIQYVQHRISDWYALEKKPNYVLKSYNILSNRLKYTRCNRQKKITAVADIYLGDNVSH